MAKITYVKTSSLTKKMAQLAMAVILIVLAVNLWFTIAAQGRTMLSENALVLAENILLQTAHSARTYINSEDTAGLDQLTDSALQSPYILEMVIYDSAGLVLSKSANAISTKARFATQLHDEVSSQHPIPFVQQIRSEQGELLGFVRITVLRKALQSVSDEYVKRILDLILILLILAGITGYLLTLGLRPFSRNAYFVD